MKKIKQLIIIFLAVLLSTVIGNPVSAAKLTQAERKAIRKSYEKYMKQDEDCFMFPVKLYLDMNKDGIKEMMRINRSEGTDTYRFYTYYNGKVTKIHKKDFTSVTGLFRVSNNSKLIGISQKINKSVSRDTIFELRKKKLKKVAVYTYKKNKNLNNGKRISNEKLRTFWNQQVFIEGESAAKNYQIWYDVDLCYTDKNTGNTLFISNSKKGQPYFNILVSSKDDETRSWAYDQWRVRILKNGQLLYSQQELGYAKVAYNPVTRTITVKTQEAEDKKFAGVYKVNVN